MRAEIKGLSSDEVDIESYIPDDPSCFLITIRLQVGPEGAQGGDDFEIFVCTPTWLQNNVWEPMWGRNFLIVRDFNYKLIMEAVLKCVSQCEGVDWPETVSKLAKFCAWEFEDYQA